MKYRNPEERTIKMVHKNSKVEEVRSISAAVFVEGHLNHFGVRILIDSGAAVSLVRDDVWKVISPGRELQPYSVLLQGATGEAIHVLGTCEITVHLGRKAFKHTLLVVTGLKQSCILGIDFLQCNQCVLDFQQRKMRVGDQMVSLFGLEATEQMCLKLDANVRVLAGHEMIALIKEVPKILSGEDLIFEPKKLKSNDVWIARALVRNSETIPLRIMNTSDHTVTLFKGTVIGTLSEIAKEKVRLAAQTVEFGTGEMQKLNLEQADITEKEKKELMEILNEFQDVMSKGPEDLGKTTLVKHKINTKQADPIKLPLRRFPLHAKQEASEIVNRMQNQGLIVPSDSPWSSPVVIVRKKDGSARFCVDYRRLNELTVKDPFPLPRVDEILETVAGAALYSTLDLASGYWQVELEETDRKKTAFSTELGHFEWTVMPMGLCNSASTFQRLMNLVLSDLHWCTAMVYLDDIIVWGKDFVEHKARLTEVLNRLREAGLKINPKKCQICKKEISFLGHKLKPNGIAVDESKTEKVQLWPTPKNIEDLRAFLGLAGYYRRYVQNFAEIAAPLHKLQNKGEKFRWTIECQKAFVKLKQRLISPPVLAHPRADTEFILDCDASGSALGCVLSQMHGPEEKVIAFASRAMNKAEKNYSTTRREMLSVIFGVKHFRYYLLGSHFTIRTDHNSLKWLNSFKNPEGQVARWLETLAEYNFSIVYRPGKEHQNADGLSRMVNYITETPIEPAWIETLGSEKIKKLQEEDELLRTVAGWVEAKDRGSREDAGRKGRQCLSLWSQFQRLTKVKGIIYRLWKEAGETRLQLVVPRCLKQEILRHVHDRPEGGHLGVHKTISKVQERFYWPGYTEDISEWCRSCSSCDQFNARGRKNRSPLQVYIPGFPFQRVGLDILGPWPQTLNRNRYVLVVSDYFTRWVEAYAIPNIEARTVARTLMEGFISRYGTPTEIHSDQGRQFEAAVFQELCELLDIKKTRTTPYHPQSDGLVERFNRTLKNMLAHFVDENMDDWDVKMPLVMLAYRSSTHESTGYTPYKMLFGRDIRLPVDVIYGRPENSFETQTEYVQELRKTLEEVHQLARDRLVVSHQHQKDVYDRKCVHGRFELDDEVYVFEPVAKFSKNVKHKSSWSGPYVVKEKLSDVTYRVESTGRNKKNRIIHVNRLRKKYTRRNSLTEEGVV